MPVKPQPPIRPTTRPKTILLVDDQDEFRITTKWFLSSFGFVVESARTAQEALAVFDPKVHDLVVTDNSMPGMSGAELAHVIKLRSPSTPVLMCSGSLPGDRTSLDLAIEKPIPLLKLKETVDTMLTSSPRETVTSGLT
jgi:CheY-like chemotaxis protein